MVMVPLRIMYIQNFVFKVAVPKQKQEKEKYKELFPLSLSAYMFCGRRAGVRKYAEKVM